MTRLTYCRSTQSSAWDRENLLAGMPDCYRKLKKGQECLQCVLLGGSVHNQISNGQPIQADTPDALDAQCHPYRYRVRTHSA